MCIHFICLPLLPLSPTLFPLPLLLCSALLPSLAKFVSIVICHGGDTSQVKCKNENIQQSDRPKSVP